MHDINENGVSLKVFYFFILLFIEFLEPQSLCYNRIFSISCDSKNKNLDNCI